MTVIQAIQQIFESREPEGTFAFTTEVQGDKNERYRDKERETPYCLIVPQVRGEGILTNGIYNDRLTLKVFFLESNADQWKTYAEKESNIVEPMRQLGAEVLSAVLYQYPETITLEESTTLRHDDIYDWGSGNHCGVAYTFNVRQKRILNLCGASIVIQEIFTDSPTTNVFADTSGNGNDATVKNIQIATLDGNSSIYYGRNLLTYGVTIEDSQGTSVLSSSEKQINATAGSLESLELPEDDGLYFQEQKGERIYNIGGDYTLHVGNVLRGSLNTSTRSYTKNTTVELAATPDTGFVFEKYIIDGVDELSPTPSILVNKNYDIIPVFNGNGNILAPTNARLTVQSDTESLIEWDVAEAGRQYIIERSEDGVVYEVIGTTAIDTTQYSDTGLTANKLYYYRIIVIDGSDASEYLYLDSTYTWMRYWETDSSLNNIYYGSPTGSGNNSTFDDPSTFKVALDKAIVIGDAVLLKPGTYTYDDGVELDYNGINVNNQTVSALRLIEDDVIFEFNNSGDSAGVIYNSGKTDMLFQYITIQNYGSTSFGSHIFFLLGNSSGTIRNVKIKDVGRRGILLQGSARQGKWTFEKNKFQGNESVGASPNFASITIDGSANPVDVDIQYNVFSQSENYLGAGIYLNGSPGVSRTVNLYNNEFYGTQSYAMFVAGNNYTGYLTNNIFAGHGIAGTSFGFKAIEGNCAGYTNTVDYNFNFGSTQTPPYYDNQIIPGANEINGEYDLLTNKLPVDSFMMLSIDDASAFDTAGANYFQSLAEQYGWKITFFINVNGWDTGYGGTVPTQAIIDYVAAGHDIGIHSFSHTPLTKYDNAIRIAYSGGGSKDVQITTDLVGGGADWNGIIKDYSVWTGSLVLDPGGAGEQTLNLIDNGRPITFTEVKTWIDLQTDWSASVQIGTSSDVSSEAFAVTMVNGTTSVGASEVEFDVEKWSYIWLETKFAKDQMESIVSTAIGSSYTVKTFGSPFHLTNLDVMDGLKEAGYIIARGTNGVTGVTYAAWNSYNFAPFCISQFGGSDLVDGDDETTTIDNAQIAAKVGTVAGGGATTVLTVHAQTFDTPTEQTVWDKIFEIFSEYNQMGLNVISVREFAEDYSFTELTAGAGSVNRLKYTHEFNYDGVKQNESLCINAGNDLSLTTDIESEDVINTPNIGAYDYRKFDSSLVIKNINAEFWDNRADAAVAGVQKHGCQIYELDATLGVYKYVLANIDGTFKDTYEKDYTKIAEIIGGFINNGDTILGIKRTGWTLIEKTFDEIYNEPETDNYIITKTTNNITELIIKT